MSKHTPGPWEIVETTDPKIISSWKIHMGSHSIDFFPYVYQFADVEKTCGGYASDHEMHANARLIAAAPELLDALEAALPLLHTGDELPMSYYKDKPCALGKALMAISKAKEEPFPQPSKKTGGDPCGECHLQAGETCDICGAIAKAKGE